MKKLFSLFAFLGIAAIAYADVTITCVGGNRRFSGYGGADCLRDQTIGTGTSKWEAYNGDKTSATFDDGEANAIFSASQAIYVNGITLYTGNDTKTNPKRNPVKWTLYASNDDAVITAATAETPNYTHASWVMVQVVEDAQMPVANDAPKYFKFASVQTAYKYYRFHVNSLVGVDELQLGELAFDYSTTKQTVYAVHDADGGGSFNNEGAANLFDGNTGTKWCKPNAVATNWVVFHTTKPIYASRYTLGTANDAETRDPKKFKLYAASGSAPTTDGTTTGWTLIDSEDNATSVIPTTRKVLAGFTVDNPGIYQYFMLKVEEIRGSNGAFQLSEIMMADDYEIISSPAELTAFGSKVVSSPASVDAFTSYTSLNAVLTADLDMSAGHTPIGTEAKKYNGTFNGQEHSITLNINNTAEDFQALFGKATGGAVFKNLIIKGSVAGKQCNAALIGEAKGGGTITIDRVGCEATVYGTHESAYSGAFVGNNWGSQVATIISNSYNTGALSGTNVVNVVGNPGSTSTFTNVYNSGSISTNRFEQNGYGIYTNCYTTTSANATLAGLTQGIDASDVSSGKLCYLLNGDQSDIIWYQTVGTDEMPVPFATGHSQVYPNGRMHCNGTLYEDVTYSNDKDNITKDEHNYVDGFCSYCGAIPESDGCYMIGNAAQLDWFSAYVNAGNPNANGMLTADIVASASYTPIGTETYKYTGTFDGQLHSVTLNINNTAEDFQALFGKATGGAVFKNIIIKGSVAGKQCNAALIGEAKGGGTITIDRVGCEVNVSGTHDSSYSGAFVGNDYGRQVIINISNSYNAGDITGTNPASVIGNAMNGSSTFTNVYNIGTIDSRSNNKFTTNGTSVNCYTTSSGDASAAGLTQGMTTELLTSGELCYKLGAAFRQTLGTDASPKLGADSKPVILNGTYQNPASALTLDEDVSFGVHNDFDVTSVTMARTLTGGNWDAFCVPFDMTSAEIASQLGSGAEVKELTDVTVQGTNYTLAFSAASSIEAGKPYMVRVPGNVSSISLGGKTIKAGPLATTLEDLTFTGTYLCGNAPTGSFIIKDNESQRVTDAVALKAFRGYITADEGVSVRTLTFGLDGLKNGIEPGPAVADSLTFAVLGNSISTYDYGYIPSGYSIYYSASREQSAGIQVSDTWWMQLSRMSGLSFLANASWSGSRVAFDSSTLSSISPFCSDARVNALGRAGKPNFIFVLGGTNDWAHNVNVPLGEFRTENFTDSLSFRGAYQRLLYKLTTRYPKARIVCLSILPRAAGVNDKNAAGWSQADANASIQHIAEQFGQYFIDCSTIPFSSDWNKYTLDQLHPSAEGCTLVAEHITNELIRQGIITADLKRNTEVDEAERLLDISFTADGIVNNGTYNATIGKHGSVTTSYDAVSGTYIGSSNATASDYFYATYDEDSPLANAFNGNVTWEMLVRLDALADHDGNTTKTCFLGSEQDGGWCFYNNSGVASTFSYTHKSGVSSYVKNFSGNKSLESGKFYHLVVTMDRFSHVIRYYVNGELVRTGTRAGSDMLLPQCGSVKGSKGMWICLGGDATSGDYNNGAENSSACSFVFARVYDGALSQAAATSLYNNSVKSFTDVAAYYYEIDTADKLVEFASRVNSGATTLNAKLTADIDMTGQAWPKPIGCWTPKVNNANVTYKGHFDGQGHTITGLSYTTTQNYHGLFGVISTGALIENFSISGAITNADYDQFGSVVGFARDSNPTIRNVHSSVNITNSNIKKKIGGILGYSMKESTVNVDRCTYSGTLRSNDNGGDGNYGGIVGYIDNNSAANLNITNCLFDGTLTNTAGTPGQCSFGGMLGYCNAGTVTMTNCLSIGSISAKENSFGQFFGVINGSNSTYSNNYYQGTNINGTRSGGTVSGTAPTKVDNAQLLSGEICYKLNGSTQGGENWRETLGTDAYPVPSDASKKVYYMGSTYINLNTDAEGRMQISTPQDLQNFAVFVNGGDRTLDAVLLNDIDMTGKGWPQAIGNWNTGNVNSAYKGHFDGQGHAITNLVYTTTRNYHGLFGVLTSGAVVENFSISGTVTNSDYTQIGTIGFTRDTSVSIKNIKSALNFNNSKDVQIGGIIGHAHDGTTNIECCQYSGTITSTKSSDDNGNYGGIVGNINTASAIVNITNCLFDGTCRATDPNRCGVGGIIGFCSAGTESITNCLSVGTVSSSATNYGQFFGVIGTGCSATYSNCYYKGSTTHGTRGGGTPSGTPTSVNDAQLASGEVACELGEAWNQLLGADAYPAPDDTKPNVYKLAVSEVGYASLVPEVNVLAVPEGITAYAGQKMGAYLHLEPVSELPAHKAVILKAAAGTYYYNDTDAERTLGVANDLTFSETDVTADGSQYIMAVGTDDKVGFFRARTGSIIAARKAFLVSTSGVKGFIFEEDDDPTSINEELRVKNEESAVYNLSGQMVNGKWLNGKSHGIYIVNGRKVLY